MEETNIIAVTPAEPGWYVRWDKFETEEYYCFKTGTHPVISWVTFDDGSTRPTYINKYGDIHILTEEDHAIKNGTFCEWYIHHPDYLPDHWSPEELEAFASLENQNG